MPLGHNSDNNAGAVGLLPVTKADRDLYKWLIDATRSQTKRIDEAGDSCDELQRIAAHRGGQLEAALRHACDALRTVGDDYPGSSCQKWCHEEAAKAEAIDRLTNPAEPSEAWQPIETAPKDGSELLAWGYLHDDGGPYEANGQSLMGEMPDVLIARYESEYGCWIDARGGGSMDGLTHWMPLPAPPLAMTKGGGNVG